MDILTGQPIVLDLNVIIKASSGANGERLVSVEASNEEVDKEGDRILQKALMDSSAYFLKSGHFDIDHISEIGLRLGVSNPDQYIIGYPTTVKDLGEKRTGVEGQIFKNKDGTFDPHKYVYDSFWASLQTEPPTKWRSSIYGTAEDIDDSGTEAPRHVVKAIKWKSLAFTKRPVNDSIKGEAKIITAKAFVDAVKTEGLYSPALVSSAPGNSRQRLLDKYYGHIKHSCPMTDNGENLNFATIRECFEFCDGMSYADAEINTAALFHFLSRKTA